MRCQAKISLYHEGPLENTVYDVTEIKYIPSLLG